MPSLPLQALNLFSTAFSCAVSAVDSIVSLTHSKHETPADHGTYRKPSPTDKRSPCPMVNALANHGYLPRDGKNISLSTLIKAAKEGVNLAPDATLLVGLKALQASSTGNWLTFHLDDLNKHGVIEHDGSLSRQDASLGNNHVFDPEIWKTVAKHFEGKEKIDIELAARARKERLEKAKRLNPGIDLGDDAIRFSYIETALYQIVFGEGTEGNARWDWVKILFEEERLPFEEGFKRSEGMLTIAGILEIQGKVKTATDKL
ncbi:Peroxidase, family 2-domain-containing protein [Podospora fimiseda]|uniref:Peroxidase, family 2-domain-containing protein n=1 Tax=Podospora fimiseda TaxID=252190 RepID=A0AAN6YQH0_9PEZI|nr:Peroxidase, family 2-domain-containing protein [Podospora fimiseda]